MNLREKFLMRILDISNKSNILFKYRYFSNYLNTSRKEVLKYQGIKLKKLIIHAASSVPYYKKNFELRDSTLMQNTSVEDLLRILPIVDRDIIQENQQDLISSVFRTNELIKGSSSGTTGIPIEYYTDKNGMSAGMAAGYILWSMSGWQIGQRNVHIWGNKSSIERWTTLGSKIKNLLIRQKNIASIFLDDSNTINYLADRIMRFDPVSIDGYSSSIFSLAEYFMHNNLKIKSLKQVLTTAENLEEYQKEIIEKVFAPVGDLYGSGEVLGIAARPIGEDKYYILDPHVIMETIDSSIPGLKDVLITDLDNYGMPIMRYKIGDMIDDLNEPNQNSIYPFKWFRKIYGRSSEIITLPNGMKFHPVNIFGGTLFRKFPGIRKHKVIWNGKILKFMFEIHEFVDQIILKNELAELLKPYNVRFIIEFTKKIEPSKNGKYRFVEIVEPERVNN